MINPIQILELHFAEGGRIWVPVEQIERVTRYAGGENPHLSRLGGGEWQRTKSRVRKAVTDLAKELLELYSAREKVDDAAAAGWSERFYAALGRGLPFARAAREAGEGDRSPRFIVVK